MQTCIELEFGAQSKRTTERTEHRGVFPVLRHFRVIIRECAIKRQFRRGAPRYVAFQTPDPCIHQVCGECLVRDILVENSDLDVAPVDLIRSEIDLQTTIKQREFTTNFIVLNLVRYIGTQTDKVCIGRANRTWYAARTTVEATWTETIRVCRINQRRFVEAIGQVGFVQRAAILCWRSVSVKYIQVGADIIRRWT